ncbi:MAG: cytochrome C [Geobacter sp.]|nr:cytochrome C [Geobacter sp.]
MRNGIVVLGFVVLAAPRAVLGVEPALDIKMNPHGTKGSCQICHVESEESLNSWFTLGSSKRKLKVDFDTVCEQCHGVDFGHGVGEKPTLNRENLPLDADKEIACAITCHDMHIQSDDPQQHHYHLRYPMTRLCLSCHNK